MYKNLNYQVFGILTKFLKTVFHTMFSDYVELFDKFCQVIFILNQENDQKNVNLESTWYGKKINEISKLHSKIVTAMSAFVKETDQDAKLTMCNVHISKSLAKLMFYEDKYIKAMTNKEYFSKHCVKRELMIRRFSGIENDEINNLMKNSINLIEIFLENCAFHGNDYQI